MLNKLAVLSCVALAVTLSVMRWFTAGSAGGEPVDRVHVADGLIDETSCVACHVQAEEFSRTGHANTLVPAAAEISVATLKQLAQSAAAQTEGTGIDLRGDVPRVQFESSAGAGELTLDWCFGSGRHARTWVATMADSQGATDLLEFRWSWYASLQGFDVTPGQPDRHFGTYLGPCGVFYDHPKARRCFACHTTYLPIDDGRLGLSEVWPGVTCQRCHGPRRAHVESDGQVQNDFWKTATPDEAVNRCAQCHRRADEVEVDEIRPDNAGLARFQPIGLVQSKCFTESGTLTCTTCHDPHRPLDVQDSLGIWQCVQCHGPGDPTHTLCAAGHRDDCLTCHMPKVQAEDPLLFTDHWIRVR